MDANHIFQNVIQYIEKSELNYFMSKTPYSANISLKSSFIKSVVEDKIATVDLEEENLRLKKELRNTETTLKETKRLDTNCKESTFEKERFKNLYEKGKDKIKDLESQIAEFRTELLKLKSCKNKISQKLKANEDNLSRLNDENIVLKHEITALKDNLINSDKIIKFKECEIGKVNNENDSLQIKLQNLNQREINNTCTSSRFSCELCEKRTNLQTELRDHVRNIHQKHQSSQTVEIKVSEVSTVSHDDFESEEAIPCMIAKEFEEYPCFYCDEIFKEEKDIQIHNLSCHEAALSSVCDYVCDKCSAKCPN